MTAREKDYKLKLFDDVLLVFHAEVDEFGRMHVELTGQNTALRSLLPLQLFPEPTAGRILSWLTGRTVPKNRRFVENLLATAGLQQQDTLGILEVCKGLSVNDSYWLDDGTEKLSFAEINLFDNPLDETLALVAYTGYTASQRHKLGLSTEWTTDGQFAKAWRRMKNHLFLFKAGSEGFANAGMEPYSEYFAAQIAETMGIPHVPYELEMWKGKLASVCPILNDKDTSFVPFWVASGQSWFPGTLAIGYAFSPEAFQQIRSMRIFDALICNTDRHAANYGVLRDNHTGQIIGMAPLFDHNLSLFSRDMASDFPHFSERANSVFAPAGSHLSFAGESAIVMGEIQHRQLRHMIDFQFHNHPKYPISRQRLNALNEYIRNRTRELLAIPVVDENKLIRTMEQELAAIQTDSPMLHYARPLTTPTAPAK